MADNVPITAGAGTSIATDDVAGVHYQIIKQAWGPLDTANMLDDATGNRLPVKVGEALPAGTNNIGDVDVLTFPADVTDSGSLTAPAQAVTATIANGRNGVGIQVTGAWTGQLEFEVAVDGATYVAHDVVTSTGAIVNATSGNGVFETSAGGFSNFRVRASALSSGTAVVTIKTFVGSQTMHLESTLPTGSNQIGAVVSRKDLQRISIQSAGLTTAATAYSVGDQVGTIFDVANAARASGGSGMIVGVTLIDAADIIGTYDVVFFTQSVTLAADNAAFAISDADSLNVVGIATLAGAFDIGNNRVAQAFNLAMPYTCVGSTSLFAALITRTGHTFFAAVGNLQLITYVERN